MIKTKKLEINKKEEDIKNLENSTFYCIKSYEDWTGEFEVPSGTVFSIIKKEGDNSYIITDGENKVKIKKTFCFLMGC